VLTSLLETSNVVRSSQVWPPSARVSRILPSKARRESGQILRAAREDGIWIGLRRRLASRSSSIILACLVVALVGSLTGQAGGAGPDADVANDQILVRFSPRASEVARAHARGLVAGQRLRRYVLVLDWN